MAKRAVRVFLDSNVILSGLLSDRGAPRVILDILCLKLPLLIGITGRYNIIEIERNLANKLPTAIPVYKKYLPKLNLEIIQLPSQEEIKSLAGHTSDKDVPVLASAHKGKADFLVTGDKKDFSVLKTKGLYTFSIATPAEFLYTIIPEVVKHLSSVS
ncbi:MAG: PIN domain-containing protein [Deltaproteobacteria bacterium]|nr:PIN domain-containing protein [Deltaproteobacteria bacterium]